MASISARMALRSTTERSDRLARGACRRGRAPGLERRRATDGDSRDAARDRLQQLPDWRPIGWDCAWRGRARTSVGGGAVRGSGGGAAVSPRPAAGFELVAAHGDLRHRGLEIKWRLRIQPRAAEGSGRRASRRSERGRSSLSGSIRAAALRRSARGGRCLAPRRPALKFERQFQRRERPGLRRAKASFQSARSRRQRSPEFRARAAPATARFVARSVPGVPRPHQALKRIVFRSVVLGRACGSSPA